ncbi:MAG: CcmD family protein [Bacteroidia bacterium]|jgi:CcmD family protein
MERLKRLIGFFLLALVSQNARAQMVGADDIFFRNGKYYVVVAVLLIIFTGLFVYLFKLDKRIKNLEKDK